MPQILKEDVQNRIVQAALRVFAEKGFAAATIGEIASMAGVSTGNIYRYYDGKGALFEDAVDESFVGRFTMLLKDRVRSLAGVEDVRNLDPDAPWYLASEELLRFSIENRLRMVILLARAEGTRWESFARDTVYDLVRLALTHFRALNADLEIGATTHFVLVRIYENLLATNARILANHEDEAHIRQAVASYSRYHLAGLQALFDT